MKYEVTDINENEWSIMMTRCKNQVSITDQHNFPNLSTTK
jgi:hypothetical protein